MNLSIRRRWAPIIVMAVVALVSGACGSSSHKASSSSSSVGSTGSSTGSSIGSSGTSGSTSQSLPSTGPIGRVASSGQPVSGGTLLAAAGQGEPLGLDPIKNTIDGTVGLSEYAAIYDLLLRYDPTANKYVPQMAKSIAANSTNTVWTLQLRPGVRFSDGTPLNAAAVKFNIERYSTSKDSIQYYAPELAQVASITTPDNLTVVFTLHTPDAQFPWILTQGLGLIGSPTAIQKESEQAFNLHPVGAGPFMVARYSPGTELDVVRNPTYWDGPVYLDGIHFSWPQGDKLKVQALASGDLGLIHISDPTAITTAVGHGDAGYLWLRYGGASVMMNERAGHHTSDVRVRQAIAYAINPNVVNNRVFQGKGIASTALFPSGLLHTDTPPLGYDPAKARQLLQSVMQSTGWNGSLPIWVTNDPVALGEAEAVQAMLNAVGFHTTIAPAPSVSAFINNVYVTFNYDLAISALEVTESESWSQFADELVGESSPDGYNNPNMNAALYQLRAAATPAQTRAAVSNIQTIWNNTVPEVWFTVGQDAVIWNTKLHGVIPSAQSAILLGKAWLS